MFHKDVSKFGSSEHSYHLYMSCEIYATWVIAPQLNQKDVTGNDLNKDRIQFILSSNAHIQHCDNSSAQKDSLIHI